MPCENTFFFSKNKIKYTFQNTPTNKRSLAYTVHYKWKIEYLSIVHEYKGCFFFFLYPDKTNTFYSCHENDGPGLSFSFKVGMPSLWIRIELSFQQENSQLVLTWGYNCHFKIFFEQFCSHVKTNRLLSCSFEMEMILLPPLWTLLTNGCNNIYMSSENHKFATAHARAEGINKKSL